MLTKLRIAIAKGRLAEESLGLLKEAGYKISGEIFNSRKLIFTSADGQLELILVKASDVPIYVEYGAADIGIVGKDTLLERNALIYEMLDLNFGKCKFVLAGLPQNRGHNFFRVATKYPRFARELFKKRGQPVEIIELTGSIELAPLTGLCEVILDIVETGRTLKENGLVIYEEICLLSSRLVVNQVSLKTKRIEVNHLIESLKRCIERSEQSVRYLKVK